MSTKSPPRPQNRRPACSTSCSRPERFPMTTPAAIYLQDAHPIREGMEFTRYAESKGFAAVWQADSRLVRDAVVPMAAFAAVTDRITIGSGVVDCWTRNPARLPRPVFPPAPLSPPPGRGGGGGAGGRRGVA